VTATYPTGVGVQGNFAVTAVLAITDTSAPKLATEINATSSVDVSCFLYANGFNLTVNSNKGSAPRRLCTRQQLEQFGATTYSMADLIYAFDPQADDTDPDNKAKATLTQGLDLFLVVRMGLDARTTAWAATQRVRVLPVRLGEQNQVGDTTDEFAEFQIVQPAILTGPPINDAVIAA
jgi:hypothetical protein